MDLRIRCLTYKYYFTVIISFPNIILLDTYRSSFTNRQYCCYTKIYFAKNQLSPSMIKLSLLGVVHPRLLHSHGYRHFSLSTPRSPDLRRNTSNFTRTFLPSLRLQRLQLILQEILGHIPIIQKVRK